MRKKDKKKKSLLHVTYNQKSFLAPKSILSIDAIHAKIKDDGTAIVRISDCNNSVRIWNDFNTKEGKLEMLEKLEMLIDQLYDFKKEVLSRCDKSIFVPEKIQDVEYE